MARRQTKAERHPIDSPPHPVLLPAGEKGLFFLRGETNPVEKTTTLPLTPGGEVSAAKRRLREGRGEGDQLRERRRVRASCISSRQQ
ncbi:MAG: hypothetical protein Kow0089_12340 [Desulfobulbaceae bacterium]